MACRHVPPLGHAGHGGPAVRNSLEMHARMFAPVVLPGNILAYAHLCSLRGACHGATWPPYGGLRPQSLVPCPPAPFPCPPPGSRDKTVRVWDPSSASCLATLEGHQYQVTALGGPAIVSGALDKWVGLGGRAGRAGRGGLLPAAVPGRPGIVSSALDKWVGAGKEGGKPGWKKGVKEGEEHSEQGGQGAASGNAAAGARQGTHGPWAWPQAQGQECTGRTARWTRNAAALLATEGRRAGFRRMNAQELVLACSCAW